VLYVFGVFEFDPGSGELRKEGRKTALEPQPAKVLGLLLERAGEVVSREDVIASVWGGDTHVDFTRGLAYAVAQVRFALGDNADNPRFIQTLPKRGLKFIAPVRTLTEPAASTANPHPDPVVTRRPAAMHLAVVAATVLLTAGAAWTAVAMLRTPRPVIAVSRFDNETGDARYDRPLSTMADVVVDRLTSLGPDRIGVVGNAAVLHRSRKQRDLENIEQETGASHVILAQLQSRGGGLSLLLQLIRLDDGTHVWTRRIARPAGDPLVDLEDEAAGVLESGVRAHVLEAR
jgi:DNA-binding winged helix-turn-helix (wHTH) protein/TolB-like protein